ncbi:hypothetical protein GGS23DRAFT_269014 [Durotheca rogersii]|uniref:uncharacterized protein n=1 Tax=Durotheca rogersii TaxID=419775 RepID=UPI00222007E0|nr:uncharacterized protein GGS23DRAFT_269014 [Durotheca rogersii]KAI5859757.1 hypothetical protein GGS23DRAFT_269014 [Durotheca rogersii]
MSRLFLVVLGISRLCVKSLSPSGMVWCLDLVAPWLYMTQSSKRREKPCRKAMRAWREKRVVAFVGWVLIAKCCKRNYGGTMLSCSPRWSCYAVLIISWVGCFAGRTGVYVRIVITRCYLW